MSFTVQSNQCNDMARKVILEKCKGDMPGCLTEFGEGFTEERSLGLNLHE